MSKFFGGKDPFDHPFFAQPFGGLFGARSPFDDPFFTRPFDVHTDSRKQIAIEELSPDDQDGNNATQNQMDSEELSVWNPNEFQTGIQSFSFQKIAYGGPDGPYYYTSSVGRRTGGDGVTVMEMKEEDQLAGESLHTIAKGIRDKGHSVTKKKTSGGQVDSLQTLHNLNEDEIAGFEENWKTHADKALPGWSNGFNSLEDAGTYESAWNNLANWSGWPFPSLDHYGSDHAGTSHLANWGGWPFPSLEFDGYGGAETNSEPTGTSARGTSRKVIPIE
ncbi:uncharacterized protein LOC142546815 isoform X1 [Primulina tabacum]|uniref:uncharacterized protein LOC142546815 isoform X1 n=1 Tax=Primulina tabacum TaxID=48773 RepID=UPI003F5AA83E